MKRRIAVVTFPLMTLLTACTGGSEQASTPSSKTEETSASTIAVTPSETTGAKVAALSPADRTELTAAIDRTLDANSVGIDVTNESGPGTSDVATDTSWVVLEKPDRIRTVMGDTEVIQIGRDAYDNFKPLTKSGNWHHQSGVAPRDPFAELESTLHSVKIDRRAGNQFIGTAPFIEGRTTEINLELANGYVTMIQRTVVGDASQDEPTQVITYRLSQFNSTPPITAPPKDLIEVTPPGTCDGIFCSAPTNQTPSPVEIPEPATGARSTVQFRPVLSEKPSGQCESISTNPSPTENPTLHGDDGCLLLGPSALELTHATSVTAETPVFPGKTADDINVIMKLRPEDAAAFDRMAEANVGKRVAVVMFGRVLAAPEILVGEFNGSVQFFGIALDDASLLKASLIAE